MLCSTSGFAKEAGADQQVVARRMTPLRGKRTAPDVIGEDPKIALILGMIAWTKCMARSQQGHGQVIGQFKLPSRDLSYKSDRR